ncbi:MAG: triose-phosphate isomerase [Puniceicoccales bacterium]|jgi:triosephosphate isomerase|nr:triose-phosphate isomerase [Puniceicoccales bacterium]
MPRIITIAGNWKMNKTASESVDLAKPIIQALNNQNEVAVIVCPPFTALQAVSGLIENSSVRLGAQNVSDKASGAYTGEISAAMLRDLHVTHVILGHSERRAYYSETDAFINKKVLAALENNLKPILCVGETLDEREGNKTFDVIHTQIKGGLAGVTIAQAENLIIAYEPVWAIGTGKTATPALAQEVHAFIRKELSALLGESVAQKTRILYGGSMKPDNAAALLAEQDIDGGLIGGAALAAKDFLALVESGKAAAGKKA